MMLFTFKKCTFFVSKFEISNKKFDLNFYRRTNESVSFNYDVVVRDTVYMNPTKTKLNIQSLIKLIQKIICNTLRYGVKSNFFGLKVAYLYVFSSVL